MKAIICICRIDQKCKNMRSYLHFNSTKLLRIKLLFIITHILFRREHKQTKPADEMIVSGVADFKVTLFNFTTVRIQTMTFQM